MSDRTKRAAGRHLPVIVVGGGQAGLSISHFLKRQGVDHLIFEKRRLAHAWRAERWDSFCLVTPNWQCRLPGFPYPGDDPHGFMTKDEIVAYIEAYAARIDPPLIEGVEVRAVRRAESGGFAVETSEGDHTADSVVVATGGYHTPVVPKLAERFPEDVLQLHSSAYRSPDALPEGAVLVVGSGQSGCQIAEDLHLAGRRVHLAVGSAPRSPRLYRGRDATDWLHDMGHYDLPIDEHPLGEKVRLNANHYLTGRDGGREIDLRRFALEGMHLYGRLKDVDGGRLTFHDDLARNLDRADEVAQGIKTAIDRHIRAKGIAAPAEAPYRPVWRPEGAAEALAWRDAGIRAVIWGTGYRSDFRWVEVPVFDGRGHPRHERGVTAADGLYFLGLPWLYTWGSGRFSGVARDAAHVAACIEARTSRGTAARGRRTADALLGTPG